MCGKDPDDEITRDQQRNIPAAMPRAKRPKIELLWSYFPGSDSYGEGKFVQQVMEESLQKANRNLQYLLMSLNTVFQLDLTFQLSIKTLTCKSLR